MKVCKTCKAEKPEDQFYRNRAGHAPHCKPCSAKIAAEWRAKHPTYMKDWGVKNAGRRAELTKVRREKVKAQVLLKYGPRCACCGESERLFLSLDHIDNSGSAHREAVKQTDMWRVVWKAGCPDTFQVLCFNCNWGKYVNGGVCPHQVKNVALVQ